MRAGRRALAFLASMSLIMTIGSVFNGAYGQDQSSIGCSTNCCDNECRLARLATVIKDNFPLLNGSKDYPSESDAYASPDWCFQADSDPTTNWWYFRYRHYTKLSPSNESSHLLVYKPAISCITPEKQKIW